MRIRYFEGTDTLLIEFREASVPRAGIPQFSFERVAA
jgi:hypothetical protein